MAGLLNLVYSALVLLVAVAGVAFVFTTGSDDDGNGGPQWVGWALALVVAAFLAVMVGGLVT
jgi:hypothetical protein